MGRVLLLYFYQELRLLEGNDFTIQVEVKKRWAKCSLFSYPNQKRAYNRRREEVRETEREEMTTVSMITIPSTNKSSFPCQNLALKPFLPSSSSASSSFVSLRRKPSFSCTLFLQKKSKTAPIFKTHVSAQDVVEATEDSIPPLLQDNQVCILSFFSFSLKWVV